MRTATGLSLFLLVLGCRKGTDGVTPTLESCIQPPATAVTGEDAIIGKIAVDLVEKVVVDGSAEANFKSIVKADFSKLSDRNISLLLFLRAISCYLDQGLVGEEIARQMAQFVREEWSAQAGFRGKDGPLTPLELRYIEQSPDSEEIVSKLKGLGIQ